MAIKTKSVQEENGQPTYFPEPNQDVVFSREYQRVHEENVELSDAVMQLGNLQMTADVMPAFMALVVGARMLIYKYAEHDAQTPYSLDISMVAGVAILSLLVQWIRHGWNANWTMVPNLIIALSALGIHGTLLAQGESPIKSGWIVIGCLLLAGSRYPQLGVKRLVKLLNGGGK